MRLAEAIDAHPTWWRFPGEPEGVKGFLGAGLFVVGDQPSTSDWPASNPNRRAFYELLRRFELADAHLTDVYKKRGISSALGKGLPADFAEHVSFLRSEIELLKPTRVIALGELAFQLLDTHVPEVRNRLAKVWHFAYAARPGKLDEWESQWRTALRASPGRQVDMRSTLASPSREAQMGSPSRPDRFVAHRSYTTDEIRDAIGGEIESYLPSKGGRIVCGRFNLDLNPRAPLIVLPGNGPVIMQRARDVVRQCGDGSSIPVFTRGRERRWTFRGRYRALSLECQPDLIALTQRETRRSDVAGILRFALVPER